MVATQSFSDCNGMDTIDHSKVIEPQSTGVPADYRDPNHPQFPHDLESQPSQHRSCMSKKATLFAAIIVFAFLSLLAATLVGGMIGMSRMKRPTLPFVTLAPEIETMYITTTVFSTTLVPTLVAPNASTITTTTTLPPPTPTPAPSTNLFPVAPAFSWTPPATLSARPSPPAPPPAPAPVAPKEQTPNNKGDLKCFWAGRWPTKTECEVKCAGMNAKAKQKVVCNENRGFYQCQACVSE